MQHEFSHDDDLPIVRNWQPFSATAAKAYLKAVGLVTTLLVTWAGLCSI
jgi:hypothetical protein